MAEVPKHEIICLRRSWFSGLSPLSYDGVASLAARFWSVTGTSPSIRLPSQVEAIWARILRTAIETFGRKGVASKHQEYRLLAQAV